MNIKKVFISLLVLTGSVFADQIEDSVVKIYQTESVYDYYSPWSTPRQQTSVGTGFVIEGGKILTNAHVATNSAFLQIKLKNKSKKFRVYAETIGHDCDLAILVPEDPKVLEGLAPLTIAEKLAPTKNEVCVFGYPTGGDELSVTKGIVSRTEVRTYAHSKKNPLLCSQVDAAINPGNSGGPVLCNNEVVGVVHQASREGQNIGYMIPVPVVTHFLKDAKNAPYEGFPLLGLSAQSMETPALREHYGMNTEQTGILVTHIAPNSSAKGTLEEEDIILSVEGLSIDNNGMVTIPGYDPVFAVCMFSQKFYGENIDVQILRKGPVLEKKIFLDSKKKGEPLISGLNWEAPRYYIQGGLVFQPLNAHLFDFCSGGNTPHKSGVFYYEDYGKVTENRSEIVLLSRVLLDDVNNGYQHLFYEVVSKINGKTIKNFDDVALAFEGHTGLTHEVLLENDTRVILDQNFVKDRNKIILSNYAISDYQR